MTLGDIIKQYREKSGDSMDVFSQKSGISKAYVSILERNINPISQKPPIPSLEKIKAVSEVVGIDFNTVIAMLDGEQLVSLTDRDVEVRFLAPTVVDGDDVVTFYSIGSVAAGYNELAVEDYSGDPVDVPRQYLHGRKKDDFFVLTVHGNSMYPKYLDGDKVLVLRQDTLHRSGDIGVILYDGDQATLKKVEFVMGEDWMRFVPINPEYQSRTIEGVDLELCRVLGVPRLLIREIDD